MDKPENASVINLKSLGGSLALLLFAVLAVAALVATVLHFEQQIDQAHKQAKARQAETRARLSRAHDDEREIREKIQRYQGIVAQGRTDSERRLDWVETLRHIKESRRLLGLDYEIAPQRPLDARALTSGNHDFLVSPMTLEMPLLHENDLLGLIADLSAQVNPLISVRRCSLERLPPGPSRTGQALLKAQCEIDWITLRERS